MTIYNISVPDKSHVESDFKKKGTWYTKLMIKKGLLVCMVYTSMAWGLDLYPLPESFTHTIRVSPYYEVFKFKKIELDVAGGGNNTLYESIGVAINWGVPFSGWEFHYKFMNAHNLAQLNTDAVQTKLSIDTYKIRKYFSVIQDQNAEMALFVSYGIYSGYYEIQQLSESKGISAYKKRNVEGSLVDVGALFSYPFNPKWHIYLAGAYQYCLNKSVKGLLGEATEDPAIDYSGAAITLGTTLKL
jgi:hypothetical protein